MDTISTGSDLFVVPDEIEFIQQLGSGSYAKVWLATWNGKGGGSKVAIKKIEMHTVDSKKQNEILAEVKILAKLRHPNVIQIYGACFTGRELWIVIEFMEGGSLYDLLRSEEELDWHTRLRLAQQAAMGVNALHLCTPPILHRDIKSLNFVVSQDYTTLKIIDFGMSKVLSVVSSVTMSDREAIGTRRWAAPETFSPRYRWTTEADIYSLGLVFYEIALRKIPFHEVNNSDVIPLILDDERPDIHECRRDFADIIKECWQTCKEKRPSSVQLLQKLRPLLETSKSQAVKPRSTSLPYISTHSSASSIHSSTPSIHSSTSSIRSSTPSIHSPTSSIYSPTSTIRSSTSSISLPASSTHLPTLASSDLLFSPILYTTIPIRGIIQYGGLAATLVPNPPNGPQLLLCPLNANDARQQWILPKNPNGFITSANPSFSNFVWDVKGGKSDEGQRVILYPKNEGGRANQLWTISADGVISSALANFTIAQNGSAILYMTYKTPAQQATITGIGK